jgi:neutral ceramidase
MRTLLALFATLSLLAVAAHATAADWKAGVAKVNITPKEHLWMSGYGSRDRPAEGKLTDLWAKALVIEDPEGHRIALVTLDLVGIDRETANAVRDELAKKYSLARRQVALCCSHTHTGPVLGGNLRSMYFLTDAQWKQVADYTAQLNRDIVAVVGEAIKDLALAKLSWGVGHSTIAVNRRTNKEPDVPMLRETGALKGPVDHEVPVLRVAGLDGKLRAVAFGYACHATVLPFYEWSGDYPGFAQMALEEAYPDVVALFWAGCGADQNPLPRRKVELAREYGRRIAAEVQDVLGGVQRPITGTLDSAYEEIDLPLAALPTREQIEVNAKSDNRYEAARAKVLLERLARDGQLAKTYPYPVQTWRLGPELVWITLGGEVVVDYSLRIKRELTPGATWVAGYTNDVMAYIPSRRVLTEGGYEGGGAMIYYGLPTVWAPEVEETIIRAMHKQAKAVGWATPTKE